MAEETVIQLNDLPSVDNSNSVADTNGSDNETENNCETPLMEDNDKYKKLNKVMNILCGFGLLASFQAHLGMVLAFIYAYNGYYRSFLATYGPIMMSSVFIVIVSSVWKVSKKENKIKIILLGLVSVSFNTEILIYYWNCTCHQVATLQSKSRADYKQTLQHVDDLQNLLYITTALQTMPQFFIQLTTVIFLNSTEHYFVLSLQIAMMVIAIITIICAIVTYKCYNYNEELGERHRVSLMSLALTCLSAVLYIGDVGSDLILAGQYFYYQQWLYACLTLGFVIIPGLYTIRWLTYRIWVKLHYCNLFNLVKIIFNLYPLFGYWKSLKLIRKVKKIELNEGLDSGYSEQRKRWHTELVENNFSVAVLRHTESYTESTMQLILQIAILLGQFSSFSDIFQKDVLRSKGLQMLAVCLSLINLAIGSVTMFRSQRIYQYIDNEELKEDDPLKLKGMIIEFMGYFPVVVTRILAISFVASQYPYITTGVILVNWIVVLCFLIIQYRELIVHNIFQSLIYTFTPLIISLKTEVIFQFVYLLQNVLAILFWAHAQLPHSARYVPVYVIFVSNIIGIGFRIWFRKNYRKYMKIRNTGNIQIPLAIHIIFH